MNSWMAASEHAAWAALGRCLSRIGLPALQESRVVRTIKKQLVRRSLDMLTELAKRPPSDPPAGAPEGTPSTSDYTIFWESFGKYIKLGVLDDEPNRHAPPEHTQGTTCLAATCLVSYDRVCWTTDT